MYGSGNSGDSGGGSGSSGGGGGGGGGEVEAGVRIIAPCDCGGKWCWRQVAVEEAGGVAGEWWRRRWGILVWRYRSRADERVVASLLP